MGINVDEVYAGDNMNAAYVKGKPGGSLTLRIDAAEARTFDREDGSHDKKVVLLLAGEEKVLPLNITNKNTIRDAWGPDTDAWVGKTLRIFTGKTTYMGKQVDGMFVEPQNATAAPAQPASSFSFGNSVLGPGSAASLLSKVGALTAKDPKITLDTLRFALHQKHPALEAVIAGSVDNWPRSFADDIKTWIATQEEENSIPF